VPRIDADDINFPDRLEKQVAFLDAHPEVAVVGSSMRFIDNQGKDSNHLYEVPTSHEAIVHKFLLSNYMAHPSVLFRREAIIQVGNYHPLSNVEDYDLWLRLASVYQLANIAEPLVYYRIHEQSETRIAIKEKRIEPLIHERLIAHAPKLFGCHESEMKQLLNRKHPSTLQAIQHIAKHLEATQEKHQTSPWKSFEFLQSIQNFIDPDDMETRLLVSLHQPQPIKAFSRELKSITKHYLKKVTLISIVIVFVKRHYYHQQWKRKFRTWLKQRDQEKTTLPKQIDFCSNPYPDLDNVKIEPECSIEHGFSLWLSPDKGAKPLLNIKKKSYIARNTYIGVFQPISIGEYVQIGAYSYIISGNHNYVTRDIPIMQQGFTGAPIVIEDDVWIGTHVVVLPGVKIGKGAIIAAHSLVNRDVPAYEVWGGIPAKFLKHRP
jgi:acetyltransferase-like isoleucine patch superfamily enzyme